MKLLLSFGVMFCALAVTTLPCIASAPPSSIVPEESADWEIFWTLQAEYNQGVRDETTLLELGAAARKVKYFEFSKKVLRELLNSDPDNIHGCLELAKALLGSGEAAEAYTLLHSCMESGEVSIEIYLLLGLSAEGLGNYNEAIRYLATYLDLEKPAPLARLKLATVFFRNGNYSQAREQALLVQAITADTEIFNNAEALLRNIESKRFSRWSLQVGVGYLYDSNATLGPKQEDVFYSGIDYSGTSDSTAIDDQALVLQGAFRHTVIKPAAWGWITYSGINRIDYAHEDISDYLNLYVASGPRYIMSSADVKLPFIVTGTQYGDSSELTILRYGLLPQVIYRLSACWQFQGTINLQGKKDNDVTERSSRILMMSPAIRYAKKGFNVFMECQVGRESAKEDHYSYSLSGIKGSVASEWLKGMHTTIWGGYFWRDYDELEPDYDVKRQDRTDRIGFSILFDLAGPRCTLDLSINHLENHSNIPSHRFEQNQFYTTLRINY